MSAQQQQDPKLELVEETKRNEIVEETQRSAILQEEQHKRELAEHEGAQGQEDKVAAASNHHHHHHHHKHPARQELQTPIMSIQVPMLYKYEKGNHRESTEINYQLLAEGGNSVLYKKEYTYNECGEFGGVVSEGKGTWELVKDGAAVLIKMHVRITNPDEKTGKDQEQEFPVGKDGLVEFGEGFTSEVPK